MRKLHSIIKIPKFDGFHSTSTDQQSSTDYEEVVSIKWQQKIFSKTERAYYAQKENCKTDLDKRYHQMIKEESNDESVEGGLIFTYTNDDKYQPSDNFGPRDFPQTNLRKQIENKSIEKEETSSKLFADPNQQISHSRYSTGEDFVNLFIMADLEPITLLVTISYRKSDGVFIIFPDFNSISNEYRLEIDQNSKQLFGYCVENLSLTSHDASNQLEQQEKLKKIQEEISEHMRRLNLNKDPDFVFPKFCRILLLIEIIDGTDFDYDNLHVRYHIKLPKFVKVIEGNIEGSTHSSFKNDTKWNFGFCHSLVLDIDDEFFLSSSKVDTLAINFEVISIDSTWKRERREGLATLKLPLEGRSEKQEFELLCFRDLQGNSFLHDFLERFFLGGIHKTSILDQEHNEIVNFYGNKTVSSGKLKVKIQKIAQTQMSKRSFANLKSIEEIINFYHQAKARLKN